MYVRNYCSLKIHVDDVELPNGFTALYKIKFMLLRLVGEII